MLMLNNGSISWRSWRKTTVFISIYDWEYIAQAETECKAVWIRGFLGKLEIHKTVTEEGYPKPIFSSTIIFADN